MTRLTLVHTPASMDSIAFRRNWKPFGAAATGESVTTRSIDDIPFEFIQNKASGNQSNIPSKPSADDNTQTDFFISSLKKFQEKCRARQTGCVTNPQSVSSNDSHFENTSDKSNKFIPSAIARYQHSGPGDRFGRRKYENSVRITNLSSSATEADIRDLTEPFGGVSRVYIPFDKQSEENHGFAFVDFVNKEDAIRAIDKLNGWGYDNLILSVEWASPRT